MLARVKFGVGAFLNALTRPRTDREMRLTMVRCHFHEEHLERLPSDSGRV